MLNSTAVPKKPLIIGVGGGSCTGKSTLCSFFDPQTTRIIDLDAIAKNLSKKGGPIWKAVVKTWGTKILDSKGNLCRHKLRKIVFRNKKMLLLLNQITHPLIYWETKKIISKSTGYPLIIINGAILWEGGFYTMLDYLVIIKAHSKIQKERLLKRGLSISEVEQLIKSQFFQKCLEKRADLIINNDYDNPEKLKLEIQKLWKAISSRSRPESN